MRFDNVECEGDMVVDETWSIVEEGETFQHFEYDQTQENVRVRPDANNTP